MDMEITQVTYYKLEFDGCNKDVEKKYGIDTKNNTIGGKELYFTSKEKASAFVMQLCDGVKKSRFKITNDSGDEVEFNHIFNHYTRQDDDYSFNDRNRLYVSVRTDEHKTTYGGMTYTICLMLSVSPKTLNIVK